MNNPIRVLLAAAVWLQLQGGTAVAQVYSWSNFAGLPGTSGNADGTGGAARFYYPSGVAVDGGGNVHVADYINNTIRKVTPGGDVTTLAGSAGQAGSTDGTGGGARFYAPSGVALDGGGTVYVADMNNHTIRKVTAEGVVTTLAGSAGQAGGNDGTGGAARFDHPSGVAVDGGGNVYVADQYNHTIRKVTPGGEVTTLAGRAGTYGSADGTGGEARFFNPPGVAVDSAGNVYVADLFNHTIRKVTSGGEVTTLAGSAGQSGSSDGAGGEARFNFPRGITVDNSGNVYVTDYNNHTIRKVTAAGVVSTLGGTPGVSGVADGVGADARFKHPAGVAVSVDGSLWVADLDNHRLSKGLALLPDLAVELPEGHNLESGNATVDFGAVAVGGNATLTFNLANTGTAELTGIDVGLSGANAADFAVVTVPAATLATGANTTLTVRFVPGGAGNRTVTLRIASDDPDENPFAIQLAGTGSLIVPELEYSWTNFAGKPGVPGNADGTGGAARFWNPLAIAVDGGGNAYVADRNNHTLRKVTLEGVVTTLAGSAGSRGSADGTGGAARFWNPYGVAAAADGTVYVADTFNHTIRKVTAGGVVTTLAGTAGIYGSADGTGGAAMFYYPTDVAVDGGGNIYVADTYNHTIRKVTAEGVVTTLAGSAGSLGSADGTGSAARFNQPFGVAADDGGNVYVADTLNYMIRKVTAGGVVTTLAGGAGQAGGLDGTGDGARFNQPYGVAVDGGGNVYVADTSNHTIRKVTPAGVVSTIGGTPGASGSADGVGAEARFKSPWGVAASASGALWVSDTSNERISAGRGIEAAPDIAVEQPEGNGLESGNATVDFGAVAVGGNATLTFTLGNAGTAELTGIDTGLDGAHAADFAVVAAPSASLVSGANTTLTVRFAPEAAGNRTATLRIASNDPDENPFDILLAGTGTDPDADGDGVLDSWETDNGFNAMVNGDVFTLDTDGDGDEDLLEIFQGTGRNSSGEHFGMRNTQATLNGGMPQLRTQYRRGTSQTAVGGTVIWSLDLANWHLSGQTAGGVTVALEERVIESGPDHEMVEVAATVVSGTALKLFLTLDLQPND